MPIRNVGIYQQAYTVRCYSAEVHIDILTRRVEFGMTVVGIYKSLKFIVCIEHLNTSQNFEPTPINFRVMKIYKNGNTDKGKRVSNY
jgi:hypothetical protein